MACLSNNSSAWYKDLEPSLFVLVLKIIKSFVISDLGWQVALPSLRDSHFLNSIFLLTLFPPPGGLSKSVFNYSWILGSTWIRNSWQRQGGWEDIGTSEFASSELFLPSAGCGRCHNSEGFKRQTQSIMRRVAKRWIVSSICNGKHFFKLFFKVTVNLNKAFGSFGHRNVAAVLFSKCFTVCFLLWTDR